MYIVNMKQMSTADLVRNIGDATHAARQAPVVITQHKKPRFVLMDIEHYEFMRSKDPRRVIDFDNPPDYIVEHLLPQLEAYLAEKEGDDKEAAA